jgi:hypothetical protein
MSEPALAFYFVTQMRALAASKSGSAGIGVRAGNRCGEQDGAASAIIEPCSWVGCT